MASLDACEEVNTQLLSFLGEKAQVEENRRLSSHGLRPAAGPLQRPAFL